MSASSTSSTSSVSTSRTVERRDIAAGVLVLALGLAAVVGLGLTGISSPGVLDQQTAFLVLGGAILVMIPATFVLLYRSKENHRQINEHERLASAQIEALETDVDHALRREEISPRMQELTDAAREHSRAHERQEQTLERIEDTLEDGTADVDGLGVKIEEIADRQQAMFSEVLGRQADAFRDQEQMMRRSLQLEEARITSLLDRQERILEQQERLLENGHEGEAGYGAMRGSSEYPLEGLVTARSLEHRDPMPAETEPTKGQATTEHPASGALRSELEEQTDLLRDLVTSLGTSQVEDEATVTRQAPSRGAILEERPRYPVAKYNVDEIPTLGASQARELGAYGVNLTDTLLHTDLDRLAEATGIDRERLRTWQETAELMSLDGLGPALSSRLVSVGISSIEELARLDPDELSDMLLETYEGETDADNEVLTRTLPRRSEKIIDRAREASMRLHPYKPA